MNKKIFIVIGSIVGVALLLIGEYYFIRNIVCSDNNEKSIVEDSEQKDNPKAMMVLIEFKNTDGLANMVNAMDENNVNGLLMMNPDFAEANAEDLKKILSVGNVEIIASYVKEPLWDISYEDQKEILTDTIIRIEAALDVDVRIIGSKYMASDENTLKIADELGIEYVTARGTTELELTVYKADEYDAKILSISNIDTPEFKYGSLCDYSFYERAGSPDDMLKDLKRAAEEDKFVGVSHTYIGGYKERWHNMWLEFWDEENIDWVDLDSLGTVDKELPMWQIPVNKNAPYTPEKIRPVIPFEEESDVNNPCSVDELDSNLNLSGEVDISYNTQNNELVIFHNGTGPMCLEALEYFDENDIEYTEYLTSEEDFNEILNDYKETFNNVSEGVSVDFGYYPMIFIDNNAYSGFDESIQNEIDDILLEK